MQASEYLALAHAAHDACSPALAAEHYRSFIAAGGSAKDVSLALGDVLSDAGRLAEAEQAYATAVALNPREAAAALRLGRLAHRLGHLRLARAATRAGVNRTAARKAGDIGWETPLPDVVTAETEALLTASGWPCEVLTPRLSLGAPVTAGLDDTGTPDLHLLSSDPLPDVGGVRLVASVDVSGDFGGGWAGAAAAVDLAETIAPGSHLVIAFVKCSAGVSAAQVVRQAARSRKAKLIVIEHPAETPRRQLHNLSLKLAAALRADALIVRDLPLAPGPSFAGVFDADALLGAATWVGAVSAGRWMRGPARTGRVLLIRDRVLLEAGVLDGLYDGLDAAVLDLLLRANRLGFSSVSAEAGFPLTPDQTTAGVDARMLQLRWPEHTPAVAQFHAGPAVAFDRLSVGLQRANELALDLSNLGSRHDGTSELGVALARAVAAQGRFDLKVMIAREAASYHGLESVRGLTLIDPDTRPLFRACLKVGQPLTWEELLRTWSAAPVAGFYMLDAISLDVELLNIADFDMLWRLAFDHSEMMGHLSRFTQDQMRQRFGASGGQGFIALCSTCAEDYRPTGAEVMAASARDGPVVLIGNAYEHKNLLAAVRHIHAADPERELVVLGRVLQPRAGVTWLDAGRLGHDEIDRLYARAQAIVYPSLYEGFGLPVMHALARGKPVLVVDLPVFQEIKARTRWGDNLHVFSTTQALAQGLNDVCRTGRRPPRGAVREHRWADTARIVADAVEAATACFDPAALARRVSIAKLIEALVASKVDPAQSASYPGAAE